MMACGSVMIPRGATSMKGSRMIGRSTMPSCTCPGLAAMAICNSRSAIASRNSWLDAVINLNRLFVRLSARTVARRGVRSLSKSSITPMDSVLRWVRSMTVSSLCASRSSERTVSVRSRKLRPAAVSRIGRRA